MWLSLIIQFEILWTLLSLFDFFRPDIRQPPLHLFSTLLIYLLLCLNTSGKVSAHIIRFFSYFANDFCAIFFVHSVENLLLFRYND